MFAYISEKLKVGLVPREGVVKDLFFSFKKLLNLRTSNSGLHMIAVIYCVHRVDFIWVEI